MKINNVEFGFIKNAKNQVVFEKPSLEKPLCGCYLFSFLCFYFTFLGKGCRSEKAK